MAIAFSLFGNLGLNTKDFTKGVQQAQSDLKRLEGAVKATIAGFGAIRLGNMGADIVRTGLDMERLRASFTAIAGDARKGREEFAFVAQTANRLGLDVQGLAESYRSLSAATRGTTLAGTDTRELFTALSTASRAYGLSTEQTGRALQAFQQIISKGKVSQEELRQQLSEAIPGATQIAARGYGVTTQALDVMIEKGLTAIEFTRKFTAQLQKEVVQGTEVAGAGFARLGNAIAALKDRIAQSGVLAFLDQVANKLANILNRDTVAAQTSEQSILGRLGKGAGFATPQEVKELLALGRQLDEAIQQTRLAGPLTHRGEEELALRAELERRMLDINRRTAPPGQEGSLGEMGLERFGNAAGARMTQAQAEAETIGRRFQDIRNKGLDAVEAEEDATKKAKKFAEEQAQMAEQAAQRRVRLFDEVQTRQDHFLESLQMEIDTVLLSEDAYRRKAAAAMGFGEESATRQQELEALLFIRDVVDTITDAKQTTLEVERETLRIREQSAAIETKVIKEEAKLRRAADRDKMKDLERTQRDMADLLTNSILAFTDIGKRSFREMVDSWLQDLQRFAIRKFLAPQLEHWLDVGLKALGLFSGATGGTPAEAIQPISGTPITLPPPAAEGGFLVPGVARLVGEEGPEIFTPHQGGYLYPNGQGPGPTIIMNISTPDANSFMRSQGEIQNRVLRFFQQSQRNG